MTGKLRSLFGEFSWQPPSWLQQVVQRTAAASRTAVASARAQPRRTALLALAALVIVAGAVMAWHWWQARPKPTLVTFTVQAPARTCYECLPPGNPNPLVVAFDASVAALESSGRQLSADAPIRIAPAIAGTWTWNDDRTLRFDPDEDWPVGTAFEVTFARLGVVARHARLAEYRLRFSAPAFAATVAGTEFHQDPIRAGDKKAIVSVNFTHPVDAEAFERRVSLTMFDRQTDTRELELGATRFTVVYDKLRLNAHIHSQQLQVPQKSGRLRVRIAPGVHAARGGNATTGTLETSVPVPGLYSLAVQQLSAKVARDEQEDPSQVLIVALNHTVPEGQMPAKVEAWRLPLRHPDPQRHRQFERHNPNEPYRWDETSVRREILEASARASLQQIPGERDHYELHSFRHDAAPGSYLYVRVGQGLKSFGGYVLGESVERIVRVPDYPKEVRIAEQGSLLSLSGRKSLTVLARDVPGVRVEIGRVLARELHHLVSQTDGSFSRPLFPSWKFDSADVTERFVKTVKLPPLAPGKAHYEAIDLGEFLTGEGRERRGVFMVRVQPWDGRQDARRAFNSDWNSSTYDSAGDARLIVVTDLGLLAKRSLDGSQDVFVQSIRSGEPVAGVTVEILGRNGLPVLSAVSDAQGHVKFADLRSFQREQQPVLYLARTGSDSSFLPIEQRDRALDLSRFDVGGVANRVDQGALSAYLFSDRGLYRPGEQIRAGAIVRSQNWQRSLDGVPLRLQVIDPRGITVRRETYRVGAAGFGEILHQTHANDVAGTYTLQLSIVDERERVTQLGSVAVQVRDFLPDRLRMSTHFSAESVEGWVSPADLTARVGLHNLFGTPAQNRRVTARMTLSPTFPAFRAWPQYRFHDPQAAREGFTEQLAETLTDAAGEATFELNLQRFAPATYRLHMMTEGFEADGGRGVSAEAAQLVSPLPYLVGWKTDGGLDYVSRNAARSVELIGINPSAQRIAIGDLTLVRLETRYVSTLLRQDNGAYQYESRRKDIVLEETPLAIAAAGSQLTLRTDEPGAYAYAIRDGSGQYFARIDYRVAGAANLTRSLEKNAELQLALSAEDYAVGEEIELQIQAPYTGAGLITIERERVYAWRWFRASTTSSTQRIRVPEGLEGNAYVSVAFVRDVGSQEIYTSPLSYGVRPFSINRDARRVGVQIETASLAKPGEPLAIRYATTKPARLLVMAIDEGILQVARHRTPDPLGHFFEKRALEVSTQQILDLILPEFRRGALAAAPGGDAEGALGRHLNPFRRKGDAPVAFWSGILEADSTPRTVTYVPPDFFNGTLRLMAVAVAPDAIGVHDGRTLVRGDFVLSPNAPTTVTPGDAFEVSVGVANNRTGSGTNAQITVALKVDGGLAIDGDAQQVLTIGENREGSARFRLRALDRLGPANLAFSARSGAAGAQRRIDLSVRPATPYMTTTLAGHLRKTSREVKVERTLHPEHRKLEAGLSLLPLGAGHGLAAYLGNYPYLCTEQLVSQAMPALILGERPEFGYVRAQPGVDLPQLINELRGRQNDAGAYKLWPGGNQVAEFPSLYTQHFLIEAQELRQPVPADLLNAGNAFLRQLAARDGGNLEQERHSAYAIYLLVRQGQVMSAQAARLQKRLEERYAREWPQDLAAAWLAGAYKLMRQDADAFRIVSAMRFAAGQRTDSYSDAMTRDALLLYITARHFPERLVTLAPQVLETQVQRIADNVYHSLSAGTTLLAMDAYARALPPPEAQRLSLSEILPDKRLRQLDLPQVLLPKVDFSGEATALRFTSGAELNAYYSVTQAGFDRSVPTEAIRAGFEILRDYTDASGRALSKVKLGEQVDVHVKYRALGAAAIADVALVDLLPGGFELVIPAAGGEGSACTFCVARDPAGLQFSNPREDRVVFHGSVASEVREIVYRIKATNIGRYAVPPAYGEAMYDRSQRARSVAGAIEVTPP